MFHFFGTSVAEFHVDENIDELIKYMKSRGFEYNLWFVPCDVSDEYQIKQFAPQVEGAIYLGKYQPN